MDYAPDRVSSARPEVVSTRPKAAPPPGHRPAAWLVGLFAAGWTQLVAALTLVAMWFAWQDPLNLAWPDPERLALMGGTHLTVLLVSLGLATRFGRRKASEREAFREIWYTGGAAAGAWFGLPLYMSVTWDHLVGGGHDAATIIIVGSMFVMVGGMAGAGLALFSEPPARWLYDRARRRLAGASPTGLRLTRLAVWLAMPIMLALGLGLTCGLLLAWGPSPVAEAAYPGAVVGSNQLASFGCLGAVTGYQSADPPGLVQVYYDKLATGHRFHQTSGPGQVQPARFVAAELKSKVADLSQLGVVRYSNSFFGSAAEALDPTADACRSIRVYIQPTATGGSVIWVMQERPAHVH